MPGEVRGLINDTTRSRLIAFGTGGMIAELGRFRRRTGARRAARSTCRCAKSPRHRAATRSIATGKLGDVIRSADGGASWQTLSVPLSESEHAARPARARSPRRRATHDRGGPARRDPALERRRQRLGRAVTRCRSKPSARFPGCWSIGARKILVAVEARGAMQRVAATMATAGRPASSQLLRSAWPFWQGAVLETRRRHAGRRPGRQGRAQHRRCARVAASSTPAPDKDLFGSFADETDRHSCFSWARKARCCVRRISGVAWQPVTSGSKPRTAPHVARSALRRAAVFRRARHHPALAGRRAHVARGAERHRRRVAQGDVRAAHRQSAARG